jgi:sulfopyruvate decarboxylase TPP-binding subunit
MRTGDRFAPSASAPATAAARAAFEALRSAGVDFAVYVPDSVLHPLTALMEADPDVSAVVCSREDEGVAIAVGAWLAGRLSVVMMEGSGMGYCGLILARALLQRTPTLILASHSRVLGERFDYHGATRIVGEATAEGLGLPRLVVHDPAMLRTAIRGAVQTMAGQKVPVCLFVPGYVMSGEGP